MTSLRVSWEPPKLRNGEIVGYIVTYETAEQNDRKYFLYFYMRQQINLHNFAYQERNLYKK